MPSFQVEHLGVEPLWDMTRGDGIKVAVLDSGVWTSSALPDARVETVRCDGSPQRETSNAHGTHCASVIACSKAGAEGLAPAASILSIQVIASDGSVEVDDVLAGLELALDRSCDVISCSFVLPNYGGRKDRFLGLVRRAHLAGVPLLAAAGNLRGMPAAFPEQAPHAIVVSAHGRDDRPLDVNFNQWTDVFTLGENLDVVGDSGLREKWDGQTSAATAIASGIVALSLSALPPASRAKAGRAIDGTLKLTSTMLAGGPVSLPLMLDAPRFFEIARSTTS